MLKSICFFLSFWMIPTVFGQTDSKKKPEIGFYGKRFQVSLGAGGNVNLFSYLVNKDEQAFRKSDYFDELRKKSSKGLFNYSLHATVGYLLNERLTLSLDFNYLHGNAFSRRLMYVKSPQNYDVRFEFESFRFMPRLEINSRNSNAPAGLTYILGLGVEFNRGISKTYPMYKYSWTLDPNLGYTIYTHSLQDVHKSFSTNPQIGISALFGAEYRIPVAKWAAINLGAYTHLTLNRYILFKSIEYEDEGEKINRLMARSRIQNLFSARVGLMFLL